MDQINRSRRALGAFVSLSVMAALLYVTVIHQSNTKTPRVEDSVTDYTGDKTPVVMEDGVITENRDFGDDGEEDAPMTKPPLTTPKPTVPTPTPTSSQTQSASSTYKDGTYSAVGSYMSPGGQDSLGVTVTLSKDVVTSVSLDLQPGDRTSARYMDSFASGYESLVVGKNIANLKLTKVSGASLTPIGFNNAISQIKAKARA